MIPKCWNEVVRENEPLKNHTTMRCGGPAKLFAEPRSEEELIEISNYAKSQGLETYILGAGSNVLFMDEGFDGIVIHIGREMGGIEITDEGDSCLIKAGGGCSMALFGSKCASEGLEGAEFICGIPGTIGGGVYMNAGAYGREIKDIAVSARYVKDGEVHEIAAQDMKLGYRTSIFEEMEGAIVTSFTARLNKGDKQAIADLVNQLREKRTASQPLDVPSAGSTFKRPTGYYAGALIQESNLKGFALDDSGAQVSPKHAGFVVNNGGKANASDVLRLINYVIDKVKADSGVTLEPEVRIVKGGKD